MGAKVGKVMHSLAVFLFLPLFLSSCGATNGATFAVSFSYKEGEPSLQQNGDLYALKEEEYESYSYSDLLRSSSMKELADRIDAGEAIFLYCSSSTCKKCLEVEPAMKSFFLQAKVLGYGIYDNDILGSLTYLSERFPAWGMDVYSIGTPYAAVCSQDSYLPFKVTNLATSPASFASAFFERVHRSEVYSYAVAQEPTLSHEAVYYASENDPFLEKMNARGIYSSSKSLAILEPSAYVEAKEGTLRIGENGVNAHENEKEALSLLDSYLA